jgi:curved DNA-binding protein CbpA
MKQVETILKDHYHTLGVSQTASARQIKSAYRRLAHTFHPDVPETGSFEKMADINEAYEVLSNRLRRAAYDRVQQGLYNFSEEELSKATVKNNPFYDFEPMMVAAQEASEGKSKEQVLHILMNYGIINDEATEIINEVFETQSMLRKQAAISAIKFGFFAIALDAIITGILYAFIPAIDVPTVLLIVLISIVGIAFIFEFTKKFA